MDLKHKTWQLPLDSRVHTVFPALMAPSQSPGFILPHLPTETFVLGSLQTVTFMRWFQPHLQSSTWHPRFAKPCDLWHFPEICFSWSPLSTEFILSRLQRSLQSSVFDSMPCIKIICKSCWIYLQNTFKILSFPAPLLLPLRLSHHWLSLVWPPKWSPHFPSSSPCSLCSIILPKWCCQK